MSDLSWFYRAIDERDTFDEEFTHVLFYCADEVKAALQALEWYGSADYLGTLGDGIALDRGRKARDALAALAKKGPKT